MPNPDVAAVIIFHREGAYAVPALASLRKMALFAREVGLRVETIAILNNADAPTTSIVRTSGDWLTDILVNTDGDLSVARNDAALASSARYLAFFDGDDLWGDAWLGSGVAAADRDPAAIYHPTWLWYFSEQDFVRHSTGSTPHPHASSYFLRQADSTAPGFDRRALFVSNLWSANCLASRDIFLRHPYQPIDRTHGLGIEDWSWNIETLMVGGIEHKAVPDTVHLIRLKGEGSLGIRNDAEGLAVFLPDGARWEGA